MPRLTLSPKLIPVIVGSAAAAAALIFFAIKRKKDEAEIPETDGAKNKPKGGSSRAQEITKDQVQEILKEIIKSQEQMKLYMKDLTQELLRDELTLKQTYERVRKIQPNDPLDKYGLSTMDFDQLLDRHQSDSNIRESIKKIMGAPNPSGSASEKVQAITVRRIIDVHKFLLQELNAIMDDFQSLPDQDSYDLKTVTIAAQAIAGSKIEAKFGITSEDVESAVLMYHTMLATDQEFAAINIKIQHTMGKLVGTPFSPQ